MEQAAAQSGGAGSSSGAGGPSVEGVPDEYLCPITSEIMTDPVVTVRCTTLPLITRATHPFSSHLAGGRLHLRARGHRKVARRPRHLAQDESAAE